MKHKQDYVFAGVSLHALEDAQETPPEMNDEGQVVEPTPESDVEPQNENTPDENKIPRVDVVADLEKTDKELKEKIIPLPVTANALEAFDIFTPGSQWMVSLGNSIANGFGYIENRFGAFVDKLASIRLKPEPHQAFANYAAKSNFYAINNKVWVYQPTRLGIRWTAYVKVLRELADIVSTIDRDVISPFDEYLSKSINNPTLLTSFNHKVKYEKKELDAIQNKIQACFNGPLVERVTWGTAFDRNEEVIEFLTIFKETNKIILGLKPETLRKSVASLAKKANIIASGVKESSGKYQLNSKQAKQLSDMLYNVGRSVELYAVVVHLINELDHCITLSESKLK